MTNALLSIYGRGLKIIIADQIYYTQLAKMKKKGRASQVRIVWRNRDRPTQPQSKKIQPGKATGLSSSIGER